jgi:hypothetical protein
MKIFFIINYLSVISTELLDARTKHMQHCTAGEHDNPFLNITCCTSSSKIYLRFFASKEERKKEKLIATKKVTTQSVGNNHCQE